MDLAALLGALLAGLVIGFLIKPSTVVTSTYTVTNTTISIVTSIVTSLVTTLTSVQVTRAGAVPVTITVTSYFPSTVLKVTTVKVPTPVTITFTLTKIKTITNAVVTSIETVSTVERVRTITLVSTTTVYPKEVPKPSLPYLGPHLAKIYEVLDELRRTYEALSSKSNPIVEQFRKAMQKRFKLVAEILNLQNDLNLLVRYYRDLIDSSEALRRLGNETLNYNNIYKGYMYLLNMKVDMAMIDSTLIKLRDKIRELWAKAPVQDYHTVEAVLGEPVEEFLMNVSKPMKALEAIPLMERATAAGGPDVVVNAYLWKVLMKLTAEYNNLVQSWLEAKRRFNEEYSKYHEMFSNLPS